MNLKEYLYKEVWDAYNNKIVDKIGKDDSDLKPGECYIKLAHSYSEGIPHYLNLFAGGADLRDREDRVKVSFSDIYVSLDIKRLIHKVQLFKYYILMYFDRYVIKLSYNRSRDEIVSLLNELDLIVVGRNDINDCSIIVNTICLLPKNKIILDKKHLLDLIAESLPPSSIFDPSYILEWLYESGGITKEECESIKLYYMI